MNLSRRKFLKVGGSSAALLATVGCDQLPRELRALYQSPKHSGPFQPPTAADIDPVTHVLNRAAFGPRPGDYARVSKLGADAGGGRRRLPRTTVEPGEDRR